MAKGHLEFREESFRRRGGAAFGGVLGSGVGMGVDANDAYVGVLALGQGQRVNTSIHGCVGGQDGRGDCRSLVEKGGVLGQEEGVAVAKGLSEEMGEASRVRGLMRWVWFSNMEDVNFVGPRISA